MHRLRGQPSARRKPPEQRARALARYAEERYSDFGAMLQLDGSHHDWFDGRGPKCVLMVTAEGDRANAAGRASATGVSGKLLKRRELAAGTMRQPSGTKPELAKKTNQWVNRPH